MTGFTLIPAALASALYRWFMVGGKRSAIRPRVNESRRWFMALGFEYIRLGHLLLWCGLADELLISVTKNGACVVLIGVGTAAALGEGERVPVQLSLFEGVA